MNLDTLRSFALGVQTTVQGVAITVTRPGPDDTPVSTRGLWLGPLEESRPFGTDFQRVGARRGMAVPKTTALPNLPRGTIILAPEESIDGGTPQEWHVDGYLAAVDPDLMRVVLLAATATEQALT